MTQRIKNLMRMAAFIALIMGAIFTYNKLRRDLIHNDIADAPSTVAGYRKISAEEARQMIDEIDSLTILDVRTDAEYREQHIPGAMLIPDYEISARAEVELSDKSALILVYCHSGRRSILAATALVDIGYTQVYDFGGIIDWPYETVTE